MPFVSRPEYDPRRLARFLVLLRANALVTRVPGRPPLGFSGPSALEEMDSDLHRDASPAVLRLQVFSTS
jgi:hypothetical protein